MELARQALALKDGLFLQAVAYDAKIVGRGIGAAMKPDRVARRIGLRVRIGPDAKRAERVGVRPLGIVAEHGVAQPFGRGRWGAGGHAWCGGF